MSKRKAAVNDIIYELDNDDIEISSEDEAKDAKINRLATNEDENIILDECEDKEESSEVMPVDEIEVDTEEKPSSTSTHNGGKISPEPPEKNNTNNVITNEIGSSTKTENEVDSKKKLDVDPDGSKTTIYNEDIIIDSPASNSDLGVVGCENRTPLATVRFRDRRLATTYKKKLKKFMLRLIKLHEEEGSPGLDSDTDIELDIWPEDLIDEEFEDEPEAIDEPEDEVHEQDNLFFIDTDPCSNKLDEIPTYKNDSTLISNHVEEQAASPPPHPFRRKPPICFNCEGEHQLRECPMPRNAQRIAETRKHIMSQKVGRYHVEDEQKYGHLVPGRLTGKLRHALSLKRNQLPLHIYRMRMLGYPPGWLEEARISHSGITMFDSSGAAILDPDEEEGELCEPGCKDKFDIKKILDFPGFNVPASSRYKEEAHHYGLPPMSDQDSKILMLQMLAPNAMKAYKRKKLTLFPSASNNASTHEVAEMELDSGDETPAFPSVPPLPDDEPPPPPPPPPKSPSPEPAPPGLSPEPKTSTPRAPPPPPEPTQDKVDSDDMSSDDIEVIEVMRVGDIPVPVEEIKVKDIPVPAETELITIDDDDDNLNANSEPGSGRESPSLDDLEMKKRLLLNALEGDELTDTSLNISGNITDDNEKNDLDNKSLEESDLQVDEVMDDEKSELKTDNKTDDNEGIVNKDALSPVRADTANTTDDANENVMSTPESKAGHVKTTLYGTPVMNIASSYVKLPSDENFAKDICDVINFENLPNSTGKYKQISNILKRVKSEVDRIHDS